MRRVVVAVVLGLLALRRWHSSRAVPTTSCCSSADGCGPGTVNERTAPAMAALMQRGVRFTNSHSLFPTFTTANASAMATGHYLGDTGDFSNNIYVGFPVQARASSPVAPLENNDVLGEIDRSSGPFLNEDTILKLARDAGFSTAALGKHGPTLIFDHTERSGTRTVVVDDATGDKLGIPLSTRSSSASPAAQIRWRRLARRSSTRISRCG
jgi:arylsulfatase A-like enzyme